MRTRLARLLLAAARRLDPHVGRVLHPQAKVAWGEPAVRTYTAVNESLARQAGLAHYLAGLGAASGGGPVTGFGDADLAEGDVVTIDLPGQAAFRHRVTRIEHDGTVHTEPLGPA